MRPAGNPDHLQSVRRRAGSATTSAAPHAASGRPVVHGGFDVTLANGLRPAMPLDTVRGLERAGHVGSVHESSDDDGERDAGRRRDEFGQEIAGRAPRRSAAVLLSGT